MLQGSERLVSTLKEINENSKSMHESLMEMELRIHIKNMKYIVKKDEQMQDLVRLALHNRNIMALAMETLADSIKHNMQTTCASPLFGGNEEGLKSTKGPSTKPSLSDA